MINRIKVFFKQLKELFKFALKPSPKWVDIEGYEGLYQVSEDGFIYNVSEMRLASTFIKNDGYECVALTDKNGNVKQFRVHRIVAKAFLPNDKNRFIVRHIDGNKTNNNIKNLKWL